VTVTQTDCDCESDDLSCLSFISRYRTDFQLSAVIAGGLKFQSTGSAWNHNWNKNPTLAKAIGVLDHIQVYVDANDRKIPFAAVRYAPVEVADVAKEVPIASAVDSVSSMDRHTINFE